MATSTLINRMPKEGDRVRAFIKDKKDWIEVIVTKIYSTSFHGQDSFSVTHKGLKQWADPDDFANQEAKTEQFPAHVDVFRLDQQTEKLSRTIRSYLKSVGSATNFEISEHLEGVTMPEIKQALRWLDQEGAIALTEPEPDLLQASLRVLVVSKSRSELYAPPAMGIKAVEKVTPKQVTIFGGVRWSKEKVWFLASNHAYNKAAELHTAWNKAFKELASALRECGNYKETLDNSGLKNAENPLTMYAISYMNPDGYYSECYLDDWKPPSVELKAVKRHTACKIEVSSVERENWMLSDSVGYACCPDMETWERVLGARDAVVAASEAFQDYLIDSLGTYAEFEASEIKPLNAIVASSSEEQRTIPSIPKEGSIERMLLQRGWEFADSFGEMLRDKDDLAFSNWFVSVDNTDTPFGVAWDGESDGAWLFGQFREFLPEIVESEVEEVRSLLKPSEDDDLEKEWNTPQCIAEDILHLRGWNLHEWYSDDDVEDLFVDYEGNPVELVNGWLVVVDAIATPFHGFAWNSESGRGWTWSSDDGLPAVDREVLEARALILRSPYHSPGQLDLPIEVKLQPTALIQKRINVGDADRPTVNIDSYESLVAEEENIDPDPVVRVFEEDSEVDDLMFGVDEEDSEHYGSTPDPEPSINFKADVRTNAGTRPITRLDEAGIYYLDEGEEKFVHRDHAELSLTEIDAVLPPLLYPVKAWLRSDRINLNQGTQSRSLPLDSDTVREYATEMREDRWEWEKFPPVVFWDGSQLYPCGHHRIAAAKLADRYILCDVRPGTLRDAKRFSATENKLSSLKRTNADKLSATRLFISTLVEEYGSFAAIPKSQGGQSVPGQWSLRTIANEVGVSHSYVKKIWTEFENNEAIAALGIASADIDPLKARIRKGDRLGVIRGILPDQVSPLQIAWDNAGTTYENLEGIELSSEPIPPEPGFEELKSHLATYGFDLLASKDGRFAIEVIGKSWTFPDALALHEWIALDWPIARTRYGKPGSQVLQEQAQAPAPTTTRQESDRLAASVGLRNGHQVLPDPKPFAAPDEVDDRPGAYRPEFNPAPAQPAVQSKVAQEFLIGFLSHLEEMSTDQLGVALRKISDRLNLTHPKAYAHIAQALDELA